ncbi:MAG: nitrous oxide reductase family maturation protein NosD [Candidatus Palauibacterales bacterium]|nr:nitrous oxide reductase family maturation protein NosD [Candidatus Palauibacterales bacterium]
MASAIRLTDPGSLYLRMRDVLLYRIAVCAALLAQAPVPVRGAGAGEQEDRPPAVLRVGDGMDYERIGDALAGSVEGDTILVDPGIYREHLVVRHPVTLVGSPGAIIDGGETGTIVLIEAPAELSGFTIRASGNDQAREDSGIMVEQADGVHIHDNRLTDVLFGIYVKQSREPVIRANQIEGKDRPIPRRGDGIRLWYCSGGRVEGNRLERTRDLVVWFTTGFTIRGNYVSQGRYGLHYMYSDQNLFEDNVFVGNDVGAFLMYSKDIRFRRNRFEGASGPSGFGLGLKDADRIRAEGNSFVGNAVGIFVDDSPSALGEVNEFTANLIAVNGIGVAVLPSVHSNVFRDNAWTGNAIPVSVNGGGDALANTWNGNHWSEYTGFDEDGDGIGDTAFRHERLADDLFARHPQLRLFAFSPAVSALEVVSRLFPFLRPAAVVVDSFPLMRAPTAALAAIDAGDVPVRETGRLAGLGLVAAALGVALILVRLTGAGKPA